MRAILIIGWKSPTAPPEGLYCGLDGVKAAEVAQKACDTGKYHALRRIGQAEVMGSPLPVVPLAKAAPPVAKQAKKETPPPEAAKETPASTETPEP